MRRRASKDIQKDLEEVGSPRAFGRMSWDKYLKRYVWDDVKTPYLVRASKLTKEQASNEVFAFSLFLAVLFAVISMAALSDDAPMGRSTGVSAYAFTVACCSVVLGATRHYYAALYCSSAPVVVLCYFFVNGFPPNLHLVDEGLLLAVTLILLRYTMRVVTIARTYEDMPDSAPGA